MSLIRARVDFTTQSSRQFRKNISVGYRFIFLHGSDLDPDELQQLGLESVTDRKLVPLSQGQPLEFAGIRVVAGELSPISIRSITVDKQLYRPGEDVNFLVVHPTAAGQQVSITISESNKKYLERSIELNDAGVGHMTLPQVESGNYCVDFADGAVDSECEFQVAEYRLAALFPRLDNFLMESTERGDLQDAISVRIELMTYGVPTHGPAKFDLLDEGHVIASTQGEVVDGMAFARFGTLGLNALTVNIRMLNDPSQTASVKLRGTTSSQRELTLLSKLGPVMHGTMAPVDDAKPIRGIHLFEDGIQTAPIHVRHKSDGTLEFETAARFEQLHVKMMCPSTKGGFCEPKVLELGDIEAGHADVLKSTGPVTLVCFAGWVNGKPWEGFCVLFSPSQIEAKVHLPVEITPGQRCEIELHSAQAEMAYVVIRDSRLIEGGSPKMRLSGGLKDWGADLRSIINDQEQPLPLLAFASSEHSLVFDGTISWDQLHEARELFESGSGYSTAYNLIQLGYATDIEVAKSNARILGIPYSDLTLRSIPETVVELMPESVCREYCVLPLGGSDGRLIVAMAEPNHLDTIEKLRFILNRDLIVQVAARSAISAAINRYYGQIEGETADSILQEFTSTAIDFTETVIDFTETVDLASTAVRGGDSGGGEAATVVRGEPKTEGKILVATLVQLHNGVARIPFDVPPGNNEYDIEAFVYSGNNLDDEFDWTTTRAEFRAEKFPFIEFDLPAFIHPRDGAEGHVYFGTRSGKADVRIETPAGTIEFEGLDVDELRGKLSFRSTTGDYLATVTDPVRGDVNSVRQSVSAPGSFSRLVRPMVLLEPGERLDKSTDEDLVELHVVSDMGHAIRSMARATSNYQHCCCEQTAAKIRSAIFHYMSVDPGTDERKQCVDSIVAGVKRMESMHKPGKGFVIYPGHVDVIPAWSDHAAQHLRYLQWLLEIEVEPDLNSVARAGIEMSNDVLDAGSVGRKVVSAQNAYEQFRFGASENDRESALHWLQNKRNLNDKDSQVFNRASMAYAAATFVRSGQAAQIGKGLELARQVLKHINQEGRLYSTMDSTAAITMLSEMKIARVLRSDQAKINDSVVEQLAEFHNEVLSIEATDHPLWIRTLRRKQIQWDDYTDNVPLFVSVDGQSKPGQRVELLVELTNGYQFGDFLTVCLPPSLTRLYGGGQVKQFVVDFEGQSSLTLPLVTTGRTLDNQGQAAPHHFALCVGNMYDEERIGKSGWLKVKVNE